MSCEFSFGRFKWLIILVEYLESVPKVALSCLIRLLRVNFASDSVRNTLVLLNEFIRFGLIRPYLKVELFLHLVFFFLWMTVTFSHWILQLILVSKICLFPFVPSEIGTLDLIFCKHGEAYLAIAILDDVETLGYLACDENLLPEFELLADQFVDYG